MSVLIKDMEMPEHCGYCRFRYDGICHALQKTQYSVEECPLVLVHAQRKGEWIYNKDFACFNCSSCGNSMVRNVFPYCPWCGALMKGEEDETD